MPPPCIPKHVPQKIHPFHALYGISPIFLRCCKTYYYFSLNGKTMQILIPNFSQYTTGQPPISSAQAKLSPSL